MSDFADQVDELARRRNPRHQHPEGWEPGVRWDGTRGVLSTGPLDQAPDPAIWAHLIADWNLDPNLCEVIPDTVQVRGWDASIGSGETKRMLYYRASIRARQAPADRADVEALCKLAASRKRLAPKHTGTDTARAMVVLLSDWQIGKSEGGGSPAAVARISAAIDQIPGRVKDLARAGRAPASIHLVGMGDLREGCDGHYPMQAFQADLDEREQARVIRRLILRAVDTVLPLAPQIVLAAVPGNHGEKRKDGKAFTTWTDNVDLEVVEQVGEVMAANPDRYSHVAVDLAESLTLTRTIAGVVCTFTHMHQARRGANPQQKAEAWWAGHALGRTKPGDADLMFSAHYHHLQVSEATGRTWFQCPAMDGGSRWFTEGTGQSSPPGMLAVGVGESYGERLWGDLTVL